MKMPDFYVPGPFGAGPLRWQDDQSGELPRAVYSFFGVREVLGKPTGVGDRPPRAEEIERCRAYCEYYINAPCWRTDGAEAQFRELRTRIKVITTEAQLRRWLRDALDVAIDPF